MTHPPPALQVSSSPFLAGPVDTPHLMRDVSIALLPVILAAIYYFGVGALLVLVASAAGAILCEWFFSRPRGAHLRDGSALLTGLLVGLTLPPSIPLWMSFLGGIVAIGLGKMVWGGLGHNLFNPALVGRAFLQAAFPTAITTWTPQGQGVLTIHPANLAAPLMQGVDAITTATPLGLAKFQHQMTDLLPLLTGNVAGSTGETSAILIVLAGLWMIWRRSFDWRIPASILLTVFVFAGIVYAVAPGSYPPPWFMISSGGLLFGAIYMATDPVTSPMTPMGTWLYGAGIGVLVVLIRFWGGLPEGVMYAILLMNTATPLIDRHTKPRVFGRRSKK